MRYIALLVLMALIPMGGWSCQKAGEDEPKDSGVLKVVCTTGMVGDAARRIGGNHVQVKCMMGPGINPHSYKARESDVMAIADADLLLFNGLHLEAKLAEIFEKMGSRVDSVAVAEAIPPGDLLGHEKHAGLYDPHVWFDVSLWQYAVKETGRALAAADPANAEEYSERTAEYINELKALDGEIRQLVEELPAEQRALVTAHDAFRYFGRAYGFEVRGLQGISTQSQAGTGDVQSLSTFLAEKKIRAIFIETSVPQRSIQAVQAASRAKGWDVAIGGELFSDSMGDSGTEEGTYIGMVRYNVKTIVSGLLGMPTGDGGENYGN